MKTEIMYVEDKECLLGNGRICRVQLSKTGKTLYYQDMEFQSLKGMGYKSNFYELNSGIEYWISKPRKDGNDTLYPGVVEIDEDVQKEYWCNIRSQPENAHLSSFRCSGKYSKRKPHAELNVSGRSRNGGDRSGG